MRPEQRWYGGALVGSLLLLAIGYFFMVSPQKTQTANLDSQTASVLTANLGTKSKLRLLQKNNENLSTYKATLAQQELALPVSGDLTNFLRSLQSAADVTAIKLTTTTVGAASLPSDGTSQASVASTGASTTAGGAAVTANSTQPYEIPISLAATGTGDQLQSFLDQLQTQLSRAVLIKSAGIQSTSSNGSLSDQSTLQASIQIFVAPSATTTQSGGS